MNWYNINLNRESIWPRHKAPLVDVVGGPSGIHSATFSPKFLASNRQVCAHSISVSVALLLVPGRSWGLWVCLVYGRYVGGLVMRFASGFVLVSASSHCGLWGRIPVGMRKWEMRLKISILNMGMCAWSLSLCLPLLCSGCWHESLRSVPPALLDERSYRKRVRGGARAGRTMIVKEG